MSSLIYDWETTGKWVYKNKADHTHPDQPKPVQLAAVLVDDDWREVSSTNLLVLPEDWDIPKEAAEIHGVSTERAEKYGVPMINVMRVLNNMIETVDNVVGHNIEYDNNVTRHAMHHIGQVFDPFEGKQIRCTMLVSKRILKIPNTNPNIQDPYKFPKLEACYEHFFGEKFEGAHDAMNDVRATLRVYRHLCEMYGMKP